MCRHAWAPPPWTEDSTPHPVLTRLGDDDWPFCDGTIYDREKGECAPLPSHASGLGVASVLSTYPACLYVRCSEQVWCLL